MQIVVDIPENTYKQPTVIRQDVVQDICDAFLADSDHNIFYPKEFNNRPPTLFVVSAKDNPDGFAYFTAKLFRNSTRIRGVEMEAAVSALRMAGYYIFAGACYGDHLGYKCSSEPRFFKNSVELKRVEKFDEFIDYKV